MHTTWITSACWLRRWRGALSWGLWGCGNSWQSGGWGGSRSDRGPLHGSPAPRSCTGCCHIYPSQPSSASSCSLNLTLERKARTLWSEPMSSGGLDSVLWMCSCGKWRHVLCSFPNGDSWRGPQWVAEHSWVHWGAERSQGLCSPLGNPRQGGAVGNGLLRYLGGIMEICMCTFVWGRYLIIYCLFWS